MDHEFLLKKIKNCGITAKIFNWISNFLTDQEQVVVIEGARSYVAAVLSCVHQGTVLGPLLFLIFMNDVESYVVHSVLNCFVDDTRASKAISSEDDSQLLQKDLDNLIQSATKNNMEKHEDKFVYINFNCRSKNFYLSIQLYLTFL